MGAFAFNDNFVNANTFEKENDETLTLNDDLVDNRFRGSSDDD